jgi:hypothetical protein
MHVATVSSVASMAASVRYTVTPIQEKTAGAPKSKPAV